MLGIFKRDLDINAIRILNLAPCKSILKMDIIINIIFMRNNLDKASITSRIEEFNIVFKQITLQSLAYEIAGCCILIEFYKDKHWLYFDIKY